MAKVPKKRAELLLLSPPAPSLTPQSMERLMAGVLGVLAHHAEQSLGEEALFANLRRRLEDPSISKASIREAVDTLLLEGRLRKGKPLGITLADDMSPLSPEPSTEGKNEIFSLRVKLDVATERILLFRILLTLGAISASLLVRALLLTWLGS